MENNEVHVKCTMILACAHKFKLTRIVDADTLTDTKSYFSCFKRRLIKASVSGGNDEQPCLGGLSQVVEVRTFREQSLDVCRALRARNSRICEQS